MARARSGQSTGHRLCFGPRLDALPFDELRRHDPSPPPPESCDVLVVGAGPAGSACAQWLAKAGLHVLLADQQAFPRDKVCGDGLIPDAHKALRKLGVYDEVMAQAHPAQHVGCIGPRGGRVDVPGSVAVLPRRVLDHILVRAAQRAGAALHAPLRFEAPLLDNPGGCGDTRRGPRVIGARLKSGDTVHEVRAPGSCWPPAPCRRP